jgi:uncharacterized protein (TIGR02391 family)
MKPDKAIDRLEEDFDPFRKCPTLLDIGVAHAFLEWLNNNLEYLDHLEQKRWRIGVLRRHLLAQPDDLQATLTNAGIEVLDDQIIDGEEHLIMEMLHAYFGGNGVYRKAAQLLAYARKRTEDGDDVQIISRLRSFRLIPGVQMYTIPNVDYKSSNEEAILLRALDALNLHSHVTRVAYERIVNRDYPTAVIETVKAFFEEMRQIGVLAGESYATDDGYDLLNQALEFTKGKTLPKILLNDCQTQTEQNEQKGYYNLATGVASAMRNPIAHAPVDTTFIQARFGDPRKAFKALCLISLLLEKLDDRIAPR